MLIRLLTCLLLSLAIAGCDGWDDDSEFAIGTRSAIFVLRPDNGIGVEVAHYQDGLLTRNFENRANVFAHKLSDVDFADGYLWYASGSGKSLHRVDAETGQVIETIAELPLQPHLVSVGRKQILLADTVAQAILFLRKRDGEQVRIVLDQAPRAVLYNNQRFYLALRPDSVAIYDESALHPRATIAIGKPVESLYFDQFKSVRVQARSGDTTFQATISNNGDYLLRPGAPVAFRKYRYSEYLTVRFGTEYLDHLRLQDSLLLSTSGDTLSRQVADFEANFFDGHAYVVVRDSLLEVDMPSGEVLQRSAWSGRFRKAFFVLGSTS